MQKSLLMFALLVLPASTLAQADAKPLSLEDRTALRCSAAFALVADGQARGDETALAYPDLSQRGREFFVRNSARVIDKTGMSRTQLAAAIQAEAQALWDDDQIEKIMPSCLVLLEASGV